MVCEMVVVGVGEGDGGGVRVGGDRVGRRGARGGAEKARASVYGDVYEVWVGVYKIGIGDVDVCGCVFGGVCGGVGEIVGRVVVVGFGDEFGDVRARVWDFD